MCTERAVGGGPKPSPAPGSWGGGCLANSPRMTGERKEVAEQELLFTSCRLPALPVSLRHTHARRTRLRAVPGVPASCFLMGKSDNRTLR